jgi:exo-1,4-beta-D-glucosaminidase
VYDINLKELFSKSAALDAGPDSSVKAFDIPQEVFQTPSTVYFVRLELKDAKGAVESRNFYWVPSKLTEFDWAKTNYTHTPAKTSEDMTALRNLPPAHITATTRSEGTLVHLHVSNPSQALAFQVSVELEDAQGAKLPRITWSDNYIELMPGEECDLTALVPSDILSRVELKGKPEWKVKIEGWNVSPVVIAPHGASAKSERAM